MQHKPELFLTVLVDSETMIAVILLSLKSPLPYFLYLFAHVTIIQERDSMSII